MNNDEEWEELQKRWQQQISELQDQVKEIHHEARKIQNERGLKALMIASVILFILIMILAIVSY